MIFIVLYHCICYYGIWNAEIFSSEVRYSNIESWKLVCILALSAFVFISGFLYGKMYSSGKYTDSIKLIKSKVNRIFMPYIIWGLLLVVIFPSIYDLSTLLNGISHLWFLCMMALLFLMVILLKNKILRIPFLLIAIIVSLGCQMIIAKFSLYIPSLFALGTTILYLPVFLWGILCAVSNLSEKLNNWRPVFFYSALALLSFILIPQVIAIIPHGGFIFIPARCLWLIFIYTVLRHKIHLSKTSSSLINLDKNSLGIYIIHHILIWVVILYIPPVIPFMNQHYILAPIILFTIIFIISWLISELMHRHKITRKMLSSK